MVHISCPRFTANSWYDRILSLATITAEVISIIIHGKIVDPLASALEVAAESYSATSKK